MAIITELDDIRKLVIISLFYDDEFLSLFVLKGGNVLNIVYGINNRASMDIDVSMEKDFTADQLEEVQSKLSSAFDKVFTEAGYHVFDFKMYPTPEQVRPGYEQFWGGYTVELKIIEMAKYSRFAEDIEQLRRHATVVGTTQEKKLKIDISKYEYVAPKKLEDIDGYGIYVYTPLMVVYEKLRAICQQMVEYKDFVITNRKPRARDFFDIYSIVERWRTPVDVYDFNNVRMLGEIFAAKQVPLEFLTNIINYREYHRENFNAVQDTVTVDRLESYDFYFDYVSDMAVQLWNILIHDLQTAETAAGQTDQQN